MRNALPWLLLLMVLVAMGLGLLWGLESLRSAVRPVSDLASAVGTQVAGVLHPTPTIRPDPVTVVREVRSLARLETIQYSLEKVITAETGQGPLGFLFGDRLLLVAHGVVIAGIDLSQLQPGDVWFDAQGRVYLRLPSPEIFVVTLDNELSYVYDRDTGLLRRGDVNLEAEARRAAEAEIRRAALDDGILDQARLNAENVLYRFLRSLGYADVIFSSLDTGATPPTTATP